MAALGEAEGHRERRVAAERAQLEHALGAERVDEQLEEAALDRPREHLRERQRRPRLARSARRAARAAASCAPPRTPRSRPARSRGGRLGAGRVLQRSRAHARGHVARLLAVDRAVLELDPGVRALPGPLLRLVAVPPAPGHLHDLVLDPRLVERLLDAPARVSAELDPELRAAVELDRHGASLALHPRAADDRVAAVVEPDPGLAVAVVVGRPDDQGRVLAADPHALRALGLGAAPDADERVLLPLAPDRRLVGVAGKDAHLGRQLHQHVHHRAADLRRGLRRRPRP